MFFFGSFMMVRVVITLPLWTLVMATWWHFRFTENLIGGVSKKNRIDVLTPFAYYPPYCVMRYDVTVRSWKFNWKKTLPRGALLVMACQAGRVRGYFNREISRLKTMTIIIRRRAGSWSSCITFIVRFPAETQITANGGLYRYTL